MPKRRRKDAQGDFAEKVVEAIRVLTSTHDPAERSRLCHEMVDDPGWVVAGIWSFDLRWSGEIELLRGIAEEKGRLLGGK